MPVTSGNLPNDPMNATGPHSDAQVSKLQDSAFRTTEGGILTSPRPVEHREDEYDSAGFEMLLKMQASHFWYLGRHRFVLHAVKKAMRQLDSERRKRLRGIDLGGGCGGWVRYLSEHAPGLFAELALADSSLRALQMAGSILEPAIKKYQVDLLNLDWSDHWDAIFLLDVLEHIPQDADALRQAAKALRPGGYLFVTTPALRFFWTYNDDLAHHVRRYSRSDFARLAHACGLELCWSRYFMFFLSPLLFLSRLRSPDLALMSIDDKRALLNRTHRVPSAPINKLLQTAFSLETPLGDRIPFPWGTSILGMFRRAS